MGSTQFRKRSRQRRQSNHQEDSRADFRIVAPAEAACFPSESASLLVRTLYANATAGRSIHLRASASFSRRNRAKIMPPAREKSINVEAFRCREVFDSDLAGKRYSRTKKSSGPIIYEGLMPKADQGTFDDVAKALNCYFEAARGRRTQA
jgi:hypothetical protein